MRPLEFRDKGVWGADTLTTCGGRRMNGPIPESQGTLDTTEGKRQKKEVVTDTITVRWAVDPAERRVRHERRIGKRPPKV